MSSFKPGTSLIRQRMSEDGDFKDSAYLVDGNYQHFELGYLERGRRPKFTAQELEALVAGVEENKDIILPQGGAMAYQGSLSSSTVRQNSWKDILAKVNEVSEVKRSLPEVVKRWRYLKSRTRVKARRLTKWDKPLNDLQKRILDTVGDIEGPSNGDKEQYDEDGWDEVYEIDVGEVEDESEMDYGNHVTANGKEERTTVISDSGNHTPMTSSGTIAQLSNSGTSQTTAYPSSAPARVNPNLPSSRLLRNHPRINLERAPPVYNGQPENARELHGNAAYHTNERNNRSYADKNNVNITVQSCSCQKESKQSTVEEERLEIEKQRLEVEKQRLEIERERLEIERERLQMAKEEKTERGS